MMLERTALSSRKGVTPPITKDRSASCPFATILAGFNRINIVSTSYAPTYDLGCTIVLMIELCLMYVLLLFVL